jgi:hypothetical protein
MFCNLQICVSGKHVTQASLLEVLARKQIFLGSISSLNRVLHNIGFTFKTTDSRKRLMELGHVAISRVQFLRTYMQNLNAQNPLQCVYLDETWIFENGSVHRSWQDDSYKSIKKWNSEGKR